MPSFCRLQYESDKSWVWRPRNVASIKLIFHFSKPNSKLLPPLLPQVTVEQRSRVMNVTQEVRTGVLFMVDLAGSERAAITQVRYISYIELDPMTWPSLCPKSNLTFAVMTTQGFSINYSYSDNFEFKNIVSNHGNVYLFPGTVRYSFSSVCWICEYWLFIAY